MNSAAAHRQEQQPINLIHRIHIRKLRDKYLAVNTGGPLTAGDANYARALMFFLIYIFHLGPINVEFVFTMTPL